MQSKEEIIQFLRNTFLIEGAYKTISSSLTFLKEDSPSYKNMKLLQEWCEKLERDKNRGIISISEFEVQQNQINVAINDCLYQINEDIITRAMSIDISLSFKELVNNLKELQLKNLSKVLNRLTKYVAETSNFYFEIMALNRKFNLFQDDLSKGIISLPIWQNNFKETDDLVTEILSKIQLTDIEIIFLQQAQMEIQINNKTKIVFEIGLVQKHLSSNKVESALKYIQNYQNGISDELRNEFILINQRWNKKKQSIDLNIESSENLNIENSKLILSILNYALELNEELK